MWLQIIKNNITKFSHLFLDTKISKKFAWYALWIGFYIDTKEQTLYFCPLPTFLLKFEYNSLYNRGKHLWEPFYFSGDSMKKYDEIADPTTIYYALKHKRLQLLTEDFVIWVNDHSKYSVTRNTELDMEIIQELWKKYIKGLDIL